MSDYVREIMEKARERKAIDEVSVTSTPSAEERDESDDEDDEETEAALMEDVADELQSAKDAWAKVCGVEVQEYKVSAATLSSSNDGGSDDPLNVMDELMTALGTTYCDEVHGNALRSLVKPQLSDSTGIGDCVLSQDAFVDWYVRWVFGDADDDTAQAQAEESLTMSSIQPSRDGPCSSSSSLAPSTVKGNWSSVQWAVAPSSSTVAGVCWKCDVCMVTNKWEESRCQSCETPAPHVAKQEHHKADGTSVSSSAITPSPFGGPATKATFGSMMTASSSSSGSDGTKGAGASKFNFGSSKTTFKPSPPSATEPVKQQSFGFGTSVATKSKEGDTAKPKGFGFGTSVATKSKEGDTAKPKGFGFGTSVATKSKEEDKVKPKGFGFGTSVATKSKEDATNASSKTKAAGVSKFSFGVTRLEAQCWV